jgi:mannose-6-phosphate isomerase-like protein (cupin superfamily)
LELNEGDMFVVPKGIEHKPWAENECKVMIIEPRGVLNTGNSESDLTASNDVWI